MTARKRLTMWAGIFALFLVATAESCDTTSSDDIPAAKTSDNNATAPDETDEPTRQARNPTGKFTSSCDIQFPEDILSEDYAFVGAAKLRNTGNVGIVVRVRASWDQIASPTVREEKTVRLQRGQRRTVKFRIPATQTQVDEHQDSPDYFGGEACRLRVKIVSDFGQPPFE